MKSGFEYVPGAVCVQDGLVCDGVEGDAGFGDLLDVGTPQEAGQTVVSRGSGNRSVDVIVHADLQKQKLGFVSQIKHSNYTVPTFFLTLVLDQMKN